MQQMRHRGLVLWLIVVLLAGFVHPAAGLAQDEPATASYGSQLFLLSPDAGQEAALAALPLVVHGVIYDQEGPDRLIASGEPALSAAAAAAGIPAELLDADTSAKAYYFADAQAEDAVSLAGQFGSILYQDGAQLLLAVPAADEVAMLEALPGQGMSVELLPAEGLPLPSPEMPAPASAAGVEPANPAVQALLERVTAAEIQTWIAQLSGVQAISTGSSSVILPTRYTFASNVRTVEQAVFAQYQLLGYTPSFSNWSYGAYSGRNVVADLRGAVHPERVWLVGGHFDSNSEIPYSTAPGADDNASGTAATLAIAQALADQRLSDTVRFVQFGGEEQGKWGSISYARNLVSSGMTVMGFIDLDMIGWDGNKDRTVEIHSGTRSNSVAFAQRFLSANSTYAQGLRLELKQSSASRFSDHASFWDQGYASFMAIENFYDDAIARDRNPYYHKTGDILSRVDLDYVTRTARTALAMLVDGATLLADGPLPTATPTLTPTATPSPTRTPQPGACTELVANGGFEATAAWQFGPTATQGGYSAAQKYAGSRSVRLGIVPAGATGAEDGMRRGIVSEERNLLGELAIDGASYSSVYQTINVPASAARVTLSFWRRTGSEGAGGDFQRALLLRPGSYSLISTVLRELTSSGWQQMSYDLTSYRGQSIVIYFEVYNDNTAAAPRAWMYLDDVSVQACPSGAFGGTDTPEPSPTLEPTAAATPSPTPEPAATSTPSSTPEPAATSTPSSTPGPTATATPSLTPEPTATSVPTATPTSTPQSPVCGDGITNGDFESAAGWTIPVTANTGGYTTHVVHTGGRAARLGVPPPGSTGSQTGAQGLPVGGLPGDAAVEGAGYSSVYQTVALPAKAQTLRLSYWYLTGTEATSGNGDVQRVLLLDPVSYSVRKTLTTSLSNAANWQQASFDLSAFAGQSVVVYFGVYNDNTSAAPRTWMYIDDVSVTTCSDGFTSLQGRIPVWLPLIVQD